MTLKRRLFSPLHAILLIGVLLVGFSLVLTEHALQTNCRCTINSPIEQQSLHTSNHPPLPNESPKTPATEPEESHESLSSSSSAAATVRRLRSTLLNLLESLPNNSTQQELSRVILPPKINGNNVITLATQTGLSKLDRLVDLVGRWQGPISCAVPLTTEVDVDTLLNFIAPDKPSLVVQHVTFHVLLEQPQLPKKVNRHPINRLRNLALRNVGTDYVFLNDIDFIPPPNSHDSIAALLQQQPQQRSALSSKTFWILPAFERCKNKNCNKGTVTDVNTIPKTKQELLQAIEAKDVLPFHGYFKPGHGPTNYEKWYSTTERYSIDYDYLFEPYVIARKEYLPVYFPNFRGFGFNKMVFFMEAHYMGFQWQVLPDHFVVHMNHGGRKGRTDKGGDSKLIKEDFRNYLQRVYGVSHQELSKWK